MSLSISNSNLFPSAGADHWEAKSLVLPLVLPRGSTQLLSISIPLSVQNTTFGGVLIETLISLIICFLGIDLWKTSPSIQLVLATYKKNSYGQNYFIKIEKNFLLEPFIFPNVISFLLSHAPWDQPPLPFTFRLQLILCPSALTFSFRGWGPIVSILQNKVGTEYI